MADTNKISTVWTNFLAHMKGLEGRTDAESDSPIRRVVEGPTYDDSQPVPFLGISMTRVRRKGRRDAGWTWDAFVTFRLVARSGARDEAYKEILRKIAQVQDWIDAYVRPDAVVGFDNADWPITLADVADTGVQATAEMSTTFTVSVAAAAN